MSKEEREIKEYISHFTDVRYAKKAWSNLIGCALEGDAAPLPVSYDKDGKPTFQSELDNMAYDNVKKRLEENGISRKPMQAELIVETNILRARFSDNTFNTILERTAGKVKDEIAVTQNPYEELTDEELELLATERAKKKGGK